MSSGGDIEAVYAALQELDGLLGRIHVRAETLRNEVEHGTGRLREFEYALYRITGMLRRLHLPENIDRALAVLTSVLFTVRMLHSAFIMLNATTPFGWVMAGISLFGAIIGGGSTMAASFESYGGA